MTDAVGLQQDGFNPVLLRIDSLKTLYGEEPEVFLRNIEGALARGLPEFTPNTAPVFNADATPMAIIGGGPSLVQTLEQLRAFKGRRMVVGSAHDYLVSQHVHFDYAVVLDASPVTSNWLKFPQHGCRYLIGSQTTSAIFDALKNHDVMVWHAASDDEIMSPQQRGHYVIPGGCTAALRAIVLACYMGFQQVELFGLDSCIWDNRNTHAYDVDELHARLIQERMLVVRCGDRRFICAPYMAAQAKNFYDMFNGGMPLVKLTVHGGGLLAQIVKTQGREPLYIEQNLRVPEAKVASGS